MFQQSAWDDTIVALATPPGVGAIGVIRISGKEAMHIASRLIPKKNFCDQKSHTLHFGVIMKDDKELDEVVVSIFKSPKSYTGEDVVEISCHGSHYILQEVISLCVKEGARLARPGEFTQRAFLNGKMDLAQAEAVADLISAETQAAQHAAINQLRGGFSLTLSALREQLIHFAALIELELDFSDEDVEFADRKELKRLIHDISIQVKLLSESFKLGNVVKQGVKVTIIGRPNVGKSTLLNALINEERAIVSEIPGTTLDTIEEALNINGILFRLMDTAGIRSHTSDLIEQLGIVRSRENAAKADIILFLSDLNDMRHAPDFEWENEVATNWDKEGEFAWMEPFSEKVLLVCTKFKLWEKNMEAKGGIISPDYSMNFVDAKTGFGIEQLKEKMFKRVVGSTKGLEGNLVTNVRHFEALKHLQEGLLKVEEGLQKKISGDLLSPEIRMSLYHLGSITGKVEIDRDILGAIFSKFCIGK